MFKAVQYVAVGLVVLPVAILQAQSGTNARGASYSQSPGAAWLPPATHNSKLASAPSVADTALSICTPPIAPPKPKAKARHYTRHRSTGMVSKRVAPKAASPYKPVKKAPPPKVNGPEHPRFMCPVIQTGPTIIGTPVAADLGSEYEVPMPGTLEAEAASPMGFISSQDADFSAPQFLGDHHRSFLPFMWVVGGGAVGTGLFSAFLHGNDGNGHIPLNPLNPPTTLTPPPDDPLTPPVTTAPEPSSLALLGTGLVGLVGIVRRRRSKGK